MGFHYAALDFHGHGNSDGERGLILSYRDLIDDVKCLLSVLYRDPKAAPDALQFNIQCAPLDSSSCPFYLLGSSMGGAVALILAHMCFSRAHHMQLDRYSSACRGCILAAPAIQIKLPWYAPRFVLSPLQLFLSWTLLPLMPQLALPAASGHTSPAASHPIWDTEEYIAYVAADPSNVHSALKLQSLFSIFDLSDAAQSVVPHLTHDNMRIMILMDPRDAVTDFAGAQALHASAPISQKGQVTLVQMPNARHDVLTNMMDDALQHISAWLAV
jgi:alpha-beta hydrolase superfamily lysophospholipase